LQSWDEGGSFREALLSDPIVAGRISETELDSLFDHREQLKQIDPIFARLGLDQRIHAEGIA
jgi:adenylosuccinate lyase